MRKLFTIRNIMDWIGTLKEKKSCANSFWDSAKEARKDV